MEVIYGYYHLTDLRAMRVKTSALHGLGTV